MMLSSQSMAGIVCHVDHVNAKSQAGFKARTLILFSNFTGFMFTLLERFDNVVGLSFEYDLCNYNSYQKHKVVKSLILFLLIVSGFFEVVSLRIDLLLYYKRSRGEGTGRSEFNELFLLEDLTLFSSLALTKILQT